MDAKNKSKKKQMVLLQGSTERDNFMCELYSEVCAITMVKYQNKKLQQQLKCAGPMAKSHKEKTGFPKH